MREERHYLESRIAGLCGILAPIIALSMIFTAIAYSPWFTWEGNALSDLGMGEGAAFFNSGLVVAGVLNFFFALGVRKSLKKNRLTGIGTATLILGGASLILVGIFTEAFGVVHTIVSLGFFILSPLAIILVGVGVRGEAKMFGGLSILAGVGALIGIFATPFTLSLKGIAIPETIEALTLSAWIVGMGVKLISTPLPPPSKEGA